MFRVPRPRPICSAGCCKEFSDVMAEPFVEEDVVQRCVLLLDYWSCKPYWCPLMIENACLQGGDGRWPALHDRKDERSLTVWAPVVDVGKLPHGLQYRMVSEMPGFSSNAPRKMCRDVLNTL